VEVPANAEQKTMKTMPAIMFTCAEMKAKPARLPRISAMFLRLNSSRAFSVKRERTTVATPTRKSIELTISGNRPGPARLNWPMG